MTQSSYTGSDTRYTTCTACADSTHDNPGVCIGCETGYHVITGTETNALGVESQKGLCTDKYPCASPATEFYYATYDACSSKSEAGGYCEGNVDAVCKSGLCLNNMCCNDAAVASDCTTTCDAFTGACDTADYAEAGEACTDHKDRRYENACLGNVCCDFQQSSYTNVGSSASRCTKCAAADTLTAPYTAGMCEECSSGYHLILGTETNALGVESQKGLCTDKYPCASPATEYYWATYDACSSKSEAGGYCEGHVSCTLGLCSAKVCCNYAAVASDCTK